MARTTVLIVEDDPMIRLDAATLLEAAGLDVVEMDNADDAFAYTRPWPRCEQFAA